jgi:uncharacterized protein (DUF2147 family)
MLKSFAVLLVSFFVAHSALAHADEIVGVWQNGSGKGHIQIYKENGRYYGKIIWLKNPLNEYGRPRLDKKNQNEQLRNKPLIGSVMLRDFVFDEEDQWSGGRIYNPEDGKEYRAHLKLKDPRTLSVRGYIGFSWIGKTDMWLKVR